METDPEPSVDPGGGTVTAGRRRVLVFIKCLGYGGAEQLLVHMMRCRDRDRFDYEVAYVLQDYNALVPEIEGAGVPVHALGAASNRDLGWIPRLRTLLREGDFDVMHSHLPYAATLGRLVAATTMTPARRPALVYTEHSMWDKMAVALRIPNRATIGLDDRLLIVSGAAKASLPPSLRGRATVVIHGIDMEPVRLARERSATSRQELRAEFGVADNEVLALTVANLRQEKGHDVLLRAASLLDERGVPVRFLVAGDGPLSAELEAQRAALGLGDRLRFIGTRSDVLRLLAAADLFVLPSRHEGLPVTLMEASAMGVPVVASAVGELPSLWSDGENALLVPPEDPAALADAVTRVVGDADLRQLLAAGSLAKGDLFDVRRCVHEVEDIYDELVPAGRTPGQRR